MNIDTNVAPLAGLSATKTLKDEEENSSKFQDLLEEFDFSREEIFTDRKANEMVSDAQVEEFRTALSEKGADLYLKDLNQDKIDEIVEKYKDELMKSSDGSPESMARIADALEAFRKELMERLKHSVDAKAEDKEKMSTSTHFSLQQLQEDEQLNSTPLTTLLQK
ncbi:MAG: hypothetical protein GQ570_05060 [Helicobacteraceae bacterium]|nr:hypothetical protein [Helicobacteraceae bacterium]